MAHILYDKLFGFRVCWADQGASVDHLGLLQFQIVLARLIQFVKIVI